MNAFFNNTDYFTSYISEDVKTTIDLLLSVIVGTPLALLGIITNTINVIVFVKLGVKDPMNVSLLGLSVSDLCSSVFVIWKLIHYSPGFAEWDLPFSNTRYIFGATPRFHFVTITCCITTFIAVERCLCVTFPLKVKELITAKKVKLITVGIFMVVAVLVCPVYIFSRIVPVFDPWRNKTVYTVIPFNRVKTSWLVIYEKVYGIVVSILLTVADFVIIVVSTIILIRHLKKSSEWRNKVTTSKTASPSDEGVSGANQTSTREARVAKMVVVISMLFIACYTPIISAMFLFVLVPGLSWGGKYMEFHPMMYLIMSTLESINAMSNIIIYLRMSSNYRGMFQKLFGRGQDTLKK